MLFSSIKHFHFNLFHSGYYWRNSLQLFIMDYLDSLTPNDVSRRFQQFCVELFEKLSHKAQVTHQHFCSLDKQTLWTWDA